MRILTEPRSALVKQYIALHGDRRHRRSRFTADAIDRIADFATIVNERTENIGARRLHTVMEKLLDEISFEGSDLADKHVTIDDAYVDAHARRHRQERRPVAVHPVRDHDDPARSPRSSLSKLGSACSACSALIVVISVAACGRKGPPLPPLVRLPQPPAELTATRRGDTVDLQLSAPTANTDGSRPANVARVDVYAWAGPDIKDEDLFKHPPKIGSVAVKAPRDPDTVVEDDEPAADMEPPEGAGIDQGAKAELHETLTAESRVPIVIAAKKPAAKTVVNDTARPLIGAPLEVPTRRYVAVSVSKRGQHGPPTPRRLVPLVAAPPAPASPAVKYDETSVTLSWQAPA